jgi:hypothetical protein
MINYCISQIAGAYLLPLTILPVALALIFSYSLPVHCLFLIGLLDDMLNNSPIGFYSMLYLSAAWIFAAQSKEFPSKRMPAITLVLLFFLVNVLTYRIW